MSSKIHERIDELDEYERFLLQALIQTAEDETGKRLSLSSMRKIADDFFEERKIKQKSKAEISRIAKKAYKMPVYVNQEDKTDFKWQRPIPLRKVQEQKIREKQQAENTDNMLNPKK